jgi:hypothetical protein
MTDDPNIQAAQLQIQAVQHVKDLDQTIAAGREEYGEAEFDGMSSELVGSLGKEAPAFTVALAALDHPTAVVEYLARHQDEAAAIAAMPGAREAVALERIQSRIRPNGAGNTPSAIPTWKNSASDRGSLMDDSVSDDQWWARYKRKYGNSK